MSRLRLHAYDPDTDLRERAARAVERFSREYRAVKDPGVPIPDYVKAKTDAARKAWLASPSGKRCEAARTAKRREERQAARGAGKNGQ